jgi:FeS assembly SUF system protein
MDNPTKRVSLDTARLPGAAVNAPALSAQLDPNSTLEERIAATLKTCYDPELPVNIVGLGLIYELTIDPPGVVLIRMTLTSPGCPVAGALVGEVQNKVAALPGVTSARVELVWDPPWDKSRMTPAAQLELGLF